MLNIDMFFRKGILFIRLNGILKGKMVDKLKREVTDLVKENGIRNIVFNLEGITSIDMNGINALMQNYELCKQNDGKTLICNLDNPLVKYRVYNSRLLKYMHEASDEISAINIFNL